MSDQGSAQPGWYDDPEHPGHLRYWDGTRWTEDRRPAPEGYGEWGGTSQRQEVSTWLWQSIVATLFCCLPLGVVGIVFAAQAESAKSGGRYAEAREKADRARTWTIASIVVGAVGVVLGIILIVSGVGLDPVNMT